MAKLATAALVLLLGGCVQERMTAEQIAAESKRCRDNGLIPKPAYGTDLIESPSLSDIYIVRINCDLPPAGEGGERG